MPISVTKRFRPQIEITFDGIGGWAERIHKLATQLLHISIVIPVQASGHVVRRGRGGPMAVEDVEVSRDDAVLDKHLQVVSHLQRSIPRDSVGRRKEE